MTKSRTRRTFRNGNRRPNVATANCRNDRNVQNVDGNRYMFVVVVKIFIDGEQESFVINIDTVVAIKTAPAVALLLRILLLFLEFDDPL